MKRLLFLFSYLWTLNCDVWAQAPIPSPEVAVLTPAPSYPAAALVAKVTGAGMCQVWFDAAGHARYPIMIKSTGSKLLDENTLNFAKDHWTGRPYMRLFVSLIYQAEPGQAKTVKILGQIDAPNPPYPYQARAGNIEGSGIVEVSLDENGKVISAVMTKSTGSDILDGNTVSYIKGGWLSSGGKQTKFTVPVSYRLR